MILRDGMKMAIGVAVGRALALPLPRVFDAIFYGLHLREPRLYFAVPRTIFVVALLATYIPARSPCLPCCRIDAVGFTLRVGNYVRIWWRSSVRCNTTCPSVPCSPPDLLLRCELPWNRFL
jgi:hypothetical protein